MGKMALGFAAIVAACCITAPATAGTPEEAFVGFPNANPTVGFSGMPAPGFSGGIVIGHPGFGGSHFGKVGRSAGGTVGTWVNGGQWALYNNRTFASDSYNDWWHDRPDRAYPAWMRNNKNCERQWYAGSTLRC
jgi:hypothetical protein